MKLARSRTFAFAQGQRTSSHLAYERLPDQVFSLQEGRRDIGERRMAKITKVSETDLKSASWPWRPTG